MFGEGDGVMQQNYEKIFQQIFKNYADVYRLRGAN